MKKLLSISLTLLCAVVLFSFSASAAEKVIASGNCGDNGSNVTWKLYDTDSNGTADKLVISGSGNMKDSNHEESPWHDYCEEIEKIVINKGVTRIGDYSFMDCTFLESASIPSGITSIGNGAFFVL